MEAVLGNSKDYTLKQYLLFVDKLQTKSKVSFIFLLLVRLKNGVLFTSHCLDLDILIVFLSLLLVICMDGSFNLTQELGH